MVQRDLLKKPVEAATEARDRAQDVLEEFSKAAQEQAEQIQQFTKDLLERSQSQFVKVVDREIKRQMSAVGLATKADIRRLEKKIEALQKGTPAKKAAKKAAPAARATKKAANKATKKS
ncbi:MAG: hypothetical protein HYX32_03505 [Actinobacteria bacterium]|nr:hypothetical protein [Actinomycetota bacterium]